MRPLTTPLLWILGLLFLAELLLTLMTKNCWSTEQTAWDSGHLASHSGSTVTKVGTWASASTVLRHLRWFWNSLLQRRAPVELPQIETSQSLLRTENSDGLLGCPTLILRFYSPLQSPPLTPTLGITQAVQLGEVAKYRYKLNLPHIITNNGTN